MFTASGKVVSSQMSIKGLIDAHPDLFDEALGTALVPEPLTILMPGPIPIIAEYFVDGCNLGCANEDLLFEKILVNDVDAYYVRHYSGESGVIGRGDCYLEIFSSTDLAEELALLVGSEVTISLYREHWWGGSQLEF